MARPPRTFIPANSSQVLLVEGDDDKFFFKKICALADLNPDIQVAPPKEFNGKNSKGGVFERLPFLLKQLKDKSLSNLAIIVDADYEDTQGLGCKKTIEKITEIVSIAPYHFAEPLKLQSGGLVFKSSNNLNDIGLWVMPNNELNGMLEDFIKTCIKSDELSLLLHASTSTRELQKPKFGHHHISKAEIATWLAWQEKPGHGLYYSVKEDNLLLDTNHPLFQKLQNWLNAVFAA